jgi:hypothetical protein
VSGEDSGGPDRPMNRTARHDRGAVQASGRTADVSPEPETLPSDIRQPGDPQVTYHIDITGLIAAQCAPGAA